MLSESMPRHFRHGFGVRHDAGQQTECRFASDGGLNPWVDGDCHPETRCSAPGPRHGCKYARHKVDASRPKRERMIWPGPWSQIQMVVHHSRPLRASPLEAPVRFSAWPGYSVATCAGNQPNTNPSRLCGAVIGQRQDQRSDVARRQPVLQLSDGSHTSLRVCRGIRHFHLTF